MTDPLKGAKVAKPNKSETVAVGEEAPEATLVEAEAPPAEPELTAKELKEAASELPKVELAPAAIPPTYFVRKGGRAYFRGQQIKFTEGETFTSETWEEHAIAGFRECGVTIEQIA